MANTKESMCSNAITLLGHAPIVSFEGGDQMVVAAEQAFDMLYPAVLAQNNWRFAAQIQQLSISVEVLNIKCTGVFVRSNSFRRPLTK